MDEHRQLIQMDNLKKQIKLYNQTFTPRYEKYLNDPETLRGISFPLEYFKPYRMIFEKLSKEWKNNFEKKRILDLGCGAGGWSCYLASLGAEVMSLDVSEINIKIAKLKAQRNALTSVHAVVGDCTNICFKKDCFDMILGTGIIHHLTVNQELSLYREVFDLLKKGGSAIFMESIQNSQAIDFIRTLIPIFQKHNPRPSRLSKGWKNFVKDDPHPSRPNTTRHYRELLARFKFTQIELQEVGIFSRLDRLTVNGKLRRLIHDIDYVLKPFIPFNSNFSRNIIITLRK